MIIICCFYILIIENAFVHVARISLLNLQVMALISKDGNHVILVRMTKREKASKHLVKSDAAAAL